MKKSILVLLTWPIGIYISWMVLAEGFRQDLFELAVHEMLFMLIAIAIMLLSATFSSPNSKLFWTAIRNAVYYLFVAALGSVMIFLFFVIRISQNGFLSRAL